MSAEPAIELCKRYAIESQVASVSQSILQRIPCEFACKGDFETREPTRFACTLMTVEELAKEEYGACDNCIKHRIPALETLKDAKKRMAKTRKEIIREGMRFVVAERLQGII